MSTRPDQIAREAELDPKRISASRVDKLLSCGIAFKYQYVEGTPPEVSGSAALFGQVVHQGLEWWSTDRSQDIVPLIEKAWDTVAADTVVADFLAAYRPLSRAAIQLAHKIKQERPEIKAPRMTAQWKKSAIAKDLRRLMGEWVPKLNDGSYWRFSDRDPLPGLYDDSLVMAKRYEARTRNRPPAIQTEFQVNLEWRGFHLTGYIDTIEPVIDEDTGELLGLGVQDYKTYAKAPAQHKDYRQLVIYDIGVRELVERGVLALPYDLESVPLLVGIDFFKWTEDWRPCPPRRFWEMTEDDHERLYQELTHYSAIVESQRFLPANKGTNPDFCDYPERCCLRTTAGAGGCARPVEVPS